MRMGAVSLAVASVHGTQAAYREATVVEILGGHESRCIRPNPRTCLLSSVEPAFGAGCHRRPRNHEQLCAQPAEMGNDSDVVRSE